LLAERMRTMSLHGLSKDAWDRYSIGGTWDYKIVAPGFKYNLTDIAAAMGIHQLRRARAFHERRAQIAQAYDAGFAGLPLTTPPGPAAGDLHAWHLYPLRLSDAAPIDRDVLIERLFAAGIGCSVHYIPLHLQPYWRDRYALRAGQFPHSQHAYERMLSLPIYTRMTDADVRRVVDAVAAALV
ncbi:MAG TPA: DegT/DnrJ/EryC1/StrS family aminotransferase, partial [Burkholderiaceae bacterium]|nr:DegT/DnrJ/EryC1/StrS family aminotransferase [Burkholderiaceae bacterium]